MMLKMRDQILLTGATGKTGSRLAANLRGRGILPRLALRTPAGENAVRFDWLDETTFAAALEGVRAAYLVAPTNAAEPFEAMRPFVERALEAGVERFVLLSASSLPEGGPLMGQVHAFLRRHAPQWFVLRPTWFMQNFSEQQHLATIRDENAIYAATEAGRVPFINAQDIASVAAEALLSPYLSNRDVVLTGPEALSYDRVAELISSQVGRTITHYHLSEAELVARYVRAGMPPHYAGLLAGMDRAIARGSEDRVTGGVRDITGRPPSGFAAFAHEVREVWFPQEA